MEKLKHIYIQDSPVVPELKELLKGLDVPVVVVNHPGDIAPENRPYSVLLFTNEEVMSMEGVRKVKDAEKDYKMPVVVLPPKADREVMFRKPEVVPLLLKNLLLNYSIKSVELPKIKNFVFVNEGERTRKIRLDDIQFIQTMEHRSILRLDRGEVVVSTSIKKLLEVLPFPQFIRVHKQYAASLEKIDFIEEGMIRIGKEDIPLGPAYRKRVFNVIPFIR